MVVSVFPVSELAPGMLMAGLAGSGVASNSRPWNVSRQQWWGHQLPVWYCEDGHVTVSETEPSACAECGKGELTADTIVTAGAATGAQA